MEQIAQDIETETNDDGDSENELPVHVIPEIEVKNNFFDFTSNGASSLTLKLTETGIVVEDKDDQKNISYQSLLNALSDEVSLETDILPIIGTDYIALKKYVVSKNKHILFIESSPKTRTVNYSKTTEEKDRLVYNVPFPGLLFCAVLIQETSGDFKFDKEASRMFALKTPVLNEQTIVYKYPYTNVYGDCRICWGDSLSFLRNNQVIVSQVAGLLEVFLNAENNEDLYNSSYAPFKGENAKEVFDKMNGVTNYPYETLAKHMTFKEAVSLLTNN
jgi:hypothetical protein